MNESVDFAVVECEVEQKKMGGAAAAPRRTKNRQMIRRVWPSIDDFQSNKSLRLLRTASAWLKSSDSNWCAMQSAAAAEQQSATSSWQVTVVGRVLTGGGHQHQSK